MSLLPWGYDAGRRVCHLSSWLGLVVRHIHLHNYMYTHTDWFVYRRRFSFSFWFPFPFWFPDGPFPECGPNSLLPPPLGPCRPRVYRVSAGPEKVHTRQQFRSTREKQKQGNKRKYRMKENKFKQTKPTTTKQY